MRQPRSRKFIYKIESNDTKTKWKSILTTIPSKYHLFQILDTGELRGFIYFMDTKTVSSVQSMIPSIEKQRPMIEIADLTSITYINQYKEGEFYETGEPPRQGIRPSHKENEPKDAKKWEDVYELLLKQNQILLEENQKYKHSAPATIYNTMNIVENKTINIQLFLKEECKDAISLVDFIRGIHIEDADLLYAKERGLASAILHVFERGLEKCDVKSRPLHCTDISRETMHIKEPEGWVKDTGNRLTKAISTISNKKMQRLCDYLQRNPEYNDSTSPKYEENLRFIRNIICTEEEQSKTGRTVRKSLAKMVFMPKMVDI